MKIVSLNLSIEIFVFITFKLILKLSLCNLVTQQRSYDAAEVHICVYIHFDVFLDKKILIRREKRNNSKYWIFFFSLCSPKGFDGEIN